MPELYSGTMPLCTACLDGRCGECPDFMESELYGPYACGCEEH